MDYSPLISAYSSFFELTVAFNFAYAASKQFRELIKSGFLSDSQSLTQKLQLKIDDLEAQVTVIHQGGQLNPMYKETIEKKLSKNLEKAVLFVNDIKNSIDAAQPRMVDQLKPFYIISALFGLFILFLSGQEIIHSVFPLNELFTVLCGIVILFLVLTIQTFFSKKSSTLIYISIFILSLFSLALIYPAPICKYIEIYDFQIYNKYLVNLSLFLCIFPFIFAYTRLFLHAIIIYFTFRFKLIKLEISISKIKKNLNTHKKSSEFFNTLEDDE